MAECARILHHLPFQNAAYHEKGPQMYSAGLFILLRYRQQAQQLLGLPLSPAKNFIATVTGVGLPGEVPGCPAFFLYPVLLGKVGYCVRKATFFSIQLCYRPAFL